MDLTDAEMELVVKACKEKLPFNDASGRIAQLELEMAKVKGLLKSHFGVSI